MSGYYYSSNKNHKPTTSLKLLKRRGPDKWYETSCWHGSWGLAYFTPNKDDIEMLFYKDGFLLLDGYIYDESPFSFYEWVYSNLSNNLNQTVEFIKTLNGEYSLTYISDDYVIFCTDEFACKPLFFNNNGDDLIVSSLPNVVQELTNPSRFYRCYANTIYIYHRETKSIETVVNHEWDYSQKITHFDYVFEAWENSFRNRYVDGLSSIALSAGYDSGLMALTASKFFNDVDLYYAFNENEKNDILEQRKEFHSFTTIYLQKDLHHKNEKPLIYDFYGKSDDPHLIRLQNLAPEDLTYNQFTFSLNNLCEIYHNYMLPKGKRLIFVGRGADEIYADDSYPGFIKSDFNVFNGWFPKDLNTVYPEMITEKLLFKTSHRYDKVAGYFGIDTRFPFFDRILFQAFLNTTQELKNKEYKSWISEYFRQHAYPFNETTDTYSSKSGFYHMDENQQNLKNMIEDEHSTNI